MAGESSGGKLARVRAAYRRVTGSKLWRPFLAVAVLALASFLIYRIVSKYELSEIVDSVGEIPAMRLGLSALCAAGSYACLTLFDFLALRYAGRDVPYPYAALTSFTALSLGHNIGLAALSSGAVRYRFYARRGATMEDMAKIVVFCGLTVALGLLTLAGVALCVAPGLASRIVGVGDSLALAAGVGCIAAVALYLLMCALVRRELAVWHWRVVLPTLRLALGQLAVGTVNFALVAGCLYQVLAGVAEVNYPSVATAYVLANAAALVSHVPGGLGVIESVIEALVSGAGVIGALVMFRVIYYLVPGAIGGLVFLTVELVNGGKARTATA